MTRTSLLAAFLLCAGSSAALAQTADARTACEPDVWRLCASNIPNVGAITACLKSQKANLSPACRMVMDPAAAAPGRRRGTRSAQAQ
ncbi:MULTISPECIES: hypothetical protein [Methylobacterium]|uniref:hypothetical protein n=1 Tax=Methylobacterium TaxID=407 RepID=UPI0011C92BDD|nr:MULTISPECIES: hypothetical protein [Methylobacterium]TXN20161.1 hypothetical protein FV217_18985 [Methylobacterium sp. WL9]